jgi:hypothetical protein
MVQRVARGEFQRVVIRGRDAERLGVVEVVLVDRHHWRVERALQLEQRAIPCGWLAASRAMPPSASICRSIAAE